MFGNGWQGGAFTHKILIMSRKGLKRVACRMSEMPDHSAINIGQSWHIATQGLYSDHELSVGLSAGLHEHTIWYVHCCKWSMKLGTGALC